MDNKTRIDKKIFVLSGASGSGKSLLLSKIVEKGLCKQAPKYSSREERENGFDDIIHKNVDELKSKCDIVYERYNIFYGINTNEIKKRLKSDNQIVIISDIDTIKDLKKHFDNEALIVFIYLKELRIDNLLKERYKLNIDEEESKTLAKNILEDKKYFISVDENIKKKIQSSFPNKKKYEEFIKRYDSWLELDLDYENNKELFTSMIKGETIEELYDKFKTQIFLKEIK